MHRTTLLTILLTLLCITTDATVIHKKKPTKHMVITIDPRPCLNPGERNASTCISIYDTPMSPTAPVDACPAESHMGSFQPYSQELCIPLRTPLTALALRGQATTGVECQIFHRDDCDGPWIWTRPVKGLETTCITWPLSKLPDGARSLKCTDMNPELQSGGHTAKKKSFRNPFVDTSIGYGDGSDDVEASGADEQAF